MSRALAQDFGAVISRTLLETHDLPRAAPGLPTVHFNVADPAASHTQALQCWA